MKTKKVKEKKCAYCKQPFIPFQLNQKVCNWHSPCAEKAGKEKIAKERERIERNRKKLRLKARLKYFGEAIGLGISYLPQENRKVNLNSLVLFLGTLVVAKLMKNPVLIA